MGQFTGIAIGLACVAFPILCLPVGYWLFVMVPEQQRKAAKAEKKRRKKAKKNKKRAKRPMLFN